MQDAPGEGLLPASRPAAALVVVSLLQDLPRPFGQF